MQNGLCRRTLSQQHERQIVIGIAIRRINAQDRCKLLLGWVQLLLCDIQIPQVVVRAGRVRTDLQRIKPGVLDLVVFPLPPAPAQVSQTAEHRRDEQPPAVPWNLPTNTKSQAASDLHTAKIADASCGADAEIK